MSLRNDILAADADRVARDGIVLSAVKNGNVPSWVRTGWTSKTLTDSSGNKLEVFIMRDALAIGAESLYVPVSIKTAQEIADFLGAIIITPKLVNDVFHDSRCQKVRYQSIPGLFAPGKTKAQLAEDERYMQTSKAMLQHSDSINAKVSPTSPLVMGHSKALAIGPSLSRLGIYGGYGGSVDGWAIQGYPGPHDWTWVDYSQQLNLVSRTCRLNGSLTSLVSIFESPSLSHLVSTAGAFTPRWPTSGGTPATGGGSAPGASGAKSVAPTGGSAAPPSLPLSRRSFSEIDGGYRETALALTIGLPLWFGEFSKAASDWYVRRFVKS